MPEPTRQYIFTAGQIRLAFVVSGLGMVSILVLLLILASSRPQGRYLPLDTAQFDTTLRLATADLEGYEVLENGRATIDIRRAMELVVERGVTLPLTSIDVAAEDALGQEEDLAQAEGAADRPAADGAVALPEGSEIYAQCAGCHQATGEGIPGAFPPLAGWMPTLYNAEGGRTYLIHVMLYGLQGEIQAAGQTYSGVMPAWAQLADEEIAAVLNYELTHWENEAELVDFEPYTPQDIADARGAGLTAADVLEERRQLDLP